MPRKKATEENPELPVEAVEVPAAVVPVVEEAGAVEPAPADPPAEEPPAEPETEPEAAAVEEPPAEPETPQHVGFTSITDPYSPSNDVVVRYPLPPVVTVTASWLSDAEAKVLRAQHQPVVDAANATPETKAADPKE